MVHDGQWPLVRVRNRLVTGPELVSWFSPGYKASSGPERRIKVGSNLEIHNNHVVLTELTKDRGPKQACNQDLNQETSSGPITSLFRTRTKGHCPSCKGQDVSGSRQPDRN